MICRPLCGTGQNRSPSIRPGSLNFSRRCVHCSRAASLKAPAVAGVPIEKLRELLEHMRAARYGVLTWAAADLTFPHADLAIQSMCEFVTALNSESRFSVLPLGGSDGDLTALQVTTWQTGFPVQVDFSGGAPTQGSARHLSRHGEADAMVFVSALDASAHATRRQDSLDRSWPRRHAR